MNKNFFLFGSGNVASHLAPAIVKSGWNCKGVYSRTIGHADLLAKKINAKGFDDLEEVFHLIEKDDTLDIVILSVTDNALSEIAERLPSGVSASVIHTSGSTPMSVLSGVNSYGVLYPMQTFSKEREVVISSTPFFIEMSDDLAHSRLKTLCSDLCLESVKELNSNERMRLHMSAVFGCNFVNYLYSMASEVLKETGVPFTILQPLLEETLRKALACGPETSQTGPAVRRDQVTIDRHLNALNSSDRLHDLYSFLTDAIQSYYSTK